MARDGPDDFCVHCVSYAGAAVSCQPGADDQLWSSMGVRCVPAVVRPWRHYPGWRLQWDVTVCHVRSQAAAPCLTWFPARCGAMKPASQPNGFQTQPNERTVLCECSELWLVFQIDYHCCVLITKRSCCAHIYFVWRKQLVQCSVSEWHRC